MNQPSKLQQALASVGHAQPIVEEWVKTKPDKAALEELRKPQPTWAEQDRESKAKRKRELLAQLEDAEAALPRIREELPVREKEYADKLKNAKSNEHAILHPQEFAIEMQSLREHIGRLHLALKLPDKIRQRLALLESRQTRASLDLAAAWDSCGSEEKRIFLKRLGIHQVDNTILDRPMSVGAV